MKKINEFKETPKVIEILRILGIEPTEIELLNFTMVYIAAQRDLLLEKLAEMETK